MSTGLTKQQWYDKISNWVPSWFFEDPALQKAIFFGIARVLAAATESEAYHVTQTFIQQSEAPYTDLHGSERGLFRLLLESDAQFAVRIANLINQSNVPALKTLVDLVLIVEESIFVEHYKGGPCCNRGSFLNRNEILIEKHYNWFTVLVPPQRHDPYSFLDHQNTGHYAAYGNRGFFAGSSHTLPVGKLLSVVDQILQKNKAFGVAYRLYERKS